MLSDNTAITKVQPSPTGTSVSAAIRSVKGSCCVFATKAALK